MQRFLQHNNHHDDVLLLLCEKLDILDALRLAQISRYAREMVGRCLHRRPELLGKSVLQSLFVCVRGWPPLRKQVLHKQRIVLVSRGPPRVFRCFPCFAHRLIEPVSERVYLEASVSMHPFRKQSVMGLIAGSLLFAPGDRRYRQSFKFHIQFESVSSGHVLLTRLPSFHNVKEEKREEDYAEEGGAWAALQKACFQME